MRSQRLESVFFFALLFFATAAFLWLIQSFFDPIFWAAVLAIIFQPVKRRWLRVLRGRPSIASLLTLLTIIVVVLLPLLIVGYSLTQETVSLYTRITAGEFNAASLFERLRRTPYVPELMERFEITTEDIITRVNTYAGAGAKFAASSLMSIGQNAFRFFIKLFLTLYMLFFLLRDGETIVARIIRTLPLGDNKEKELLKKFASVSRATIKGSVVVGAAQGFAGGVLFVIAGIHAPIFWGSLMALLSMIPAVGTAVIWLPAGIIMLIGGDIWQGVVLLVGGAFGIGLIDNFLRPMLVGRDTELPDALVLISTLGGLSVLGLTGIVVGPLLASFFLVVWEMFAKEYATAPKAGK